MKERSDYMDDELMCLLSMKQGQKLVAGSQQGILDIWSVNQWEDINDRFPGHPESIDCMVKMSEDVLLTGSSDGLIRVVQLHPNELLGVLPAKHSMGFPVERLVWGHDRTCVVSCAHDNIVRSWDTSILFDEEEESEGEEQEQKEEKKKGKKKNPRQKKNSKKKKMKKSAASAFYTGMGGESEEEEDSSDF